MTKPNELRAVAASKKGEAEKLYLELADSPDEAKEKRYNDLCDEAKKLYEHAEAIEVREKKWNDIEAQSKEAEEARKAGDRSSQPLLPHTDARNAGTRHEYRLIKAINEIAEGRPLSGVEAETQAELEKLSPGKKMRGRLLIPFDLAVDSRAANNFRVAQGLERRDQLDLTTGAGGVSTVTTSDIIGLLRAMPLMTRLGARLLTNLQGKLSIPKQSQGGTLYFVDEGEPLTISNQALTQVPLQPRSAGAWTEYTRSFLKSSSFDAEQFVRSDLTEVIAVGVDRVGFSGSGSGAEPEGIVNNSEVTTVILGDPDGAVPTYSAMVDLETAVAEANALTGTMNFVTTPKGRGKLKKTPVLDSSDFPKFIWENNTVNDYPAWATNQLPSDIEKGSSSTTLSAAVLGDFSSAFYGFWGAIDVIVDTVTLATTGAVRIVMMQELDFALRYAERFSKIVDMITTDTP